MTFRGGSYIWTDSFNLYTLVIDPEEGGRFSLIKIFGGSRIWEQSRRTGFIYLGMCSDEKNITIEEICHALGLDSFHYGGVVDCGYPAMFEHSTPYSIKSKIDLKKVVGLVNKEG